MRRYQTLFLHMGFSAFYEAKTHDFGCLGTSSIHSRKQLDIFVGIATTRVGNWFWVDRSRHGKRH